MLSKKVSLADAGEARQLVPTYARRGLTRAISRLEMPVDPMDPADAYRLIHDELALDGNPELNLATFVTTWMDDEADRLMAETANKNAIDWDEYPQVVELQDRCVNMLSRLFHSGEQHTSIGTATVGSSEAIHLGGLAMKWRWRKARQAAGLPADRPNIVMGQNVQVCWEKFARYFDVEPRYVPLTDQRFIIGVDEAMALVDENTIGVVGILGSTYTGQYEPVAELDSALDALCHERGWDVPIHVDAASGGFVAPFQQPDLEWDFRLSRVRSINVSGHKYGLVYPGVGWIIWREESDLPDELKFSVDYLGGSHENFGLNFSRGAAQIVAQYYNFIRLGQQGYRDVMAALCGTAQWLASAIEEIGPFELLGRGEDLPVVCFRLTGGQPFTVFDLSDHLRQRGWIVPAYRMAPNAEDVAVLRVVVREGLSFDMAGELLADIRGATEFFHATAAAGGAVGAGGAAPGAGAGTGAGGVGAPRTHARGGRLARVPASPRSPNAARHTRGIC
jgi:glutamate decarboxylase